MDFCFSRLDPVEAGFPLVLLGYGGFFICLSLFVSFVWPDCSSQVIYFGGMVVPSCRRQEDFWPVLSTFFF
jgi:uncharacterized membrane protein